VGPGSPCHGCAAPTCFTETLCPFSCWRAPQKGANTSDAADGAEGAHHGLEAVRAGPRDHPHPLLLGDRASASVSQRCDATVRQPANSSTSSSPPCECCQIAQHSMSHALGVLSGTRQDKQGCQAGGGLLSSCGKGILSGGCRYQHPSGQTRLRCTTLTRRWVDEFLPSRESSHLFTSPLPGHGSLPLSLERGLLHHSWSAPTHAAKCWPVSRRNG